jgi:hypothetical protein
MLFKIATGPRQSKSFSGLSPAGFMIIFYCLKFETSPALLVPLVHGMDPTENTAICIYFVTM